MNIQVWYRSWWIDVGFYSIYFVACYCISSSHVLSFPKMMDAQTHGFQYSNCPMTIKSGTTPFWKPRNTLTEPPLIKGHIWSMSFSVDHCLGFAPHLLRRQIAMMLETGRCCTLLGGMASDFTKMEPTAWPSFPMTDPCVYGIYIYICQQNWGKNWW